MSNSYLTPLQALALHVEKCEKCTVSPFGLCDYGHRLIGEISKLQTDDGQLELIPRPLAEKPFVRMQIRQMIRQLTH